MEPTGLLEFVFIICVLFGIILFLLNFLVTLIIIFWGSITLSLLWWGTGTRMSTSRATRGEERRGRPFNFEILIGFESLEE
jgi:TRAP-type mannitol/chloroaromatic compound transport system permease small subunit